MTSTRASVWLLCWVCSGCAGGLATQTGDWVQVDTEHVRLRTDLGENEAVAFAADLQRHSDGLAGTALDCGAAGRTQPTHITFFAKEAAFDAVAPRDAATLAAPARTGLAEIPAELLIKPNPNPRVLRQAALRDMVHAMTAECYPGLPPWLGQGLVLFYETVEIDGDSVVLGRPKYTVTRQAELANAIARERTETTVVPDTAVPPLAELLRYEFGEFYRYIDYYDTLRERERVLISGRHAGAWALTHALLTVDPAINARLVQFILEVRFGDEALASAWERTMAGVDLARLYADWTAVHVRYPVLAYPYRAGRRRAPVTRAMSEAEVELHLAAQWSVDDEESRSAALAHLDRALELRPEDPSAYLMQAALARASGAEGEAATWLSRAVDLAPDDPAVLRSELVFRLDAPDAPLQTGRALADVALALETHAETAMQYDALARYHLEVEKDVTEARYWAARALRRDPGCASCRVTAGDLLAESGQPRLADSMYRRALNLAARDPRFDRARVLASMNALKTSAPSTSPTGANPSVGE